MVHIGPYEVMDLLGDGGMGSVYKARDPRFDRFVAIKVLHPHYQRDGHVVERFKTEAVIQAKLSHPNIVRVLDFITEEGSLAMVMEYVEGRSLSEILENEGGDLEKARALELFSQILAAIEHAHKCGLVHRDIKPANVIVQRFGDKEVAKVTDFGIAKIVGAEKQKTKTGTKLGTVTYMSPEHVRNAKNVDERSDIYSLGVTLHELLAGETPFDAETEFDVMRRTLEETPALALGEIAGIPAELRRVILKALAKDPEQRFQSCAEFRAALEGSPVELPEIAVPAQVGATDSAPGDSRTGEIAVEPEAPPERVGLLTRRPSLLPVAAAVVGLLVVTTVMVSFLGGGEESPRVPRRTGDSVAEVAVTDRQSLVSPPVQPAQGAGQPRQTGGNPQELQRALEENRLLQQKLEKQRLERDAEEEAAKAAELRRQESELREVEEARLRAARAQRERAQQVEAARQRLSSGQTEARQLMAEGRLTEALGRLRAAQELPANVISDLGPELLALRSLLSEVEGQIVSREALRTSFERSLQTAIDAFEEGQYPLTDKICANLLEESDLPSDLRERAEELSQSAKARLKEVLSGAKVGPAEQKKLVKKEDQGGKP